MTLHSLSSPTFSSLYVAFVFIDPCCAASGRCTLTVILWRRFPDISVVQYNIAILGGPLVTHVNVVFSVWDCKENKRTMCNECSHWSGSNEKGRKRFSMRGEEAKGRYARGSNTEAGNPDRGRCRESEVCAVIKELIEEWGVEQARLVKGQHKDRAREMVSIVAIVSVDNFHNSESADC
jgi:hypothetical protein